MTSATGPQLSTSDSETMIIQTGTSTNRNELCVGTTPDWQHIMEDLAATNPSTIVLRCDWDPSTMSAALNVFMNAGYHTLITPADGLMIDPWAWAATLDQPAPKLPGPPTTHTPTITGPTTPGVLSDAGNAQRLIAAYGNDIRYVTDQNEWLIWTGSHWAHDNALTGIQRRALTTIRNIRLDPTLNTTATIRFATQSESAQHLQAAINIAATHPAIQIVSEDLDDNIYLFNTLNGTINLCTGTLRPHNRGDLITRCAPTIYDPHTSNDTWDAFITNITNNDPNYATFLARLAGYSLTGATNEEILILLAGPSQSGKTAFIETLKTLCGPGYARTAEFDSFTTERRQLAARSDIADLAGARFVSATTSDNGHRLATSFLKYLTGGDTIRARIPYARKSFEFQPEFTLWLIVDALPHIPATDTGLWRRLIHLTFHSSNTPIPKQELNNPNVLQAALLWAVNGAVDWHSQGTLGAVPVTDTIRLASDPNAAFYTQPTIQNDPAAWTPYSQIRDHYQHWCTTNNIPALTNKAFAETLRLHGYTAKKARPGPGQEAVRGWTGIRITPENQVVRPNPRRKGRTTTPRHATPINHSPETSGASHSVSTPNLPGMGP